MIWLLLNGEYISPEKPITDKDYIIAVDGGIKHSNKLSIQPNIWLGDFDSSLFKDYSEIHKIKYPIDKDKTDFELALDFVDNTFQPDLVKIIGAGGGELDHSFANLLVLANYNFASIAFVKNGVWIYLPAGKVLHLQGKKDNLVSIFALTKLQNIYSKGLKWEFNQSSLDPFIAKGARNRLNQNNASIYWNQGKGLIFVGQGVTLSVK